MGDYLKLYNKVKELIYCNHFSQARESLKELLNYLNQDLINESDKNQKIKVREAILKLLPALDELSVGKITSKIIDIFSLDEKILLVKEKEDKKEKTFNYDYNMKPLSPKSLDDYIGQEKVKQAIRISINAAKEENRVLEHLLICSPYGLGKTTLANIIANEMNLPLFSINATVLKDTKSLSLYFSKMKERCIIFIDEIHSLKSDVQTVLLSIITDFKVSFIDEKGNDKMFMLPPFTLIGATTQAGELFKPFLNRFTIVELSDYTTEEKNIIVKSKFEKLGYIVEEEAINDVANRSRGIPRTIESYAKGIRDIAINKKTKMITLELVKEYFDMIGIDEYGLSQYDLKILSSLKESNHPLALITLESKTGIQKEDLEYRYEPYLIKNGFLEKTEKGRVLTEKGIKYLEEKES